MKLKLSISKLIDFHDAFRIRFLRQKTNEFKQYYDENKLQKII